MKLPVLNGPNLNMPGIREPAHCGKETYAALPAKIEGYCAERGIPVSFFRSNRECALVKHDEGTD